MLNQSVYWQPGMKLDDVEKLVIIAALRYCDGNKTKTAATLGISIPTVRAKIAQYDITMPGLEPEKAPEPPVMKRVECLACGIRFMDDPSDATRLPLCPNQHRVGVRVLAT